MSVKYLGYLDKPYRY